MLATKPHHFGDIQADLGGEARPCTPHPYGHALHSVADEMASYPDTICEIELGADAICAPCCHNINGLGYDVIDASYRPAAPCSKREWNLLVGSRWCRRLGISREESMNARRLGKLVRDRAADLCDIHPKLPPEMVRQKAEALARGVEAYLRR